MKALTLHPDRLFSPNETERSIARRLYQEVADLPIISPHGHTDPVWFADNAPFPDPANLLVTPDHYVFRMLYSQGVSLESLGIKRLDGAAVETDPRKIWALFAEHYHLFLGTPSRIWLDHALHEVFGVDVVLNAESAGQIYDHCAAALATPEFTPRALFERFNIQFLATTEGALDDLAAHDKIQSSGWQGQVVTTYRPDAVVDPEFEGFAENIASLGDLTGEDTHSWTGYLQAHRLRRQYFIARGATATDHGHPTANTANLSASDCQKLLTGAVNGTLTPAQADLFRGQMLTEMAAMSLEDGLVMQIHAGVVRNHNELVMTRFGRDKGGDLPAAANFVTGLKPLLDKFGNEAGLKVILFTLDETTYGRDLAPLAGHYPALRLGPPWWFFDSVEGMLRYKRAIIETAGFYNTCGFNDDTRAFLSIPARHDVARRMDCRHLAELVVEHRLDEDQALELAKLQANGLVKQAYNLD
ncbi:MAG: glucuronate isomerase [Pseudomonadales bacterium]